MLRLLLGKVDIQSLYMVYVANMPQFCVGHGKVACTSHGFEVIVSEYQHAYKQGKKQNEVREEGGKASRVLRVETATYFRTGAQRPVHGHGGVDDPRGAS